MNAPQQFILIILCATLCPFAVFAQQKSSVGMHHLASKQPALQPVSPEDSASIAEEVSNKDSHPAISEKDALVKPEDLEKWSHLNEAASAYTSESVKKLVALIESDRGAVPPQGLFLAAKALADNHQMERAAVYFFVGQLRLTFDVSRWPPRANEEDVKRMTEDKKKTEDQSAPNKDKEPRIINPHQGVSELANSIGSPILAWSMKDPKRLSDILNKVREWDASAQYAYDTGYPVNEPVPFERWEKLLTDVRMSYFLRMNNLVKTLGKLK